MTSRSAPAGSGRGPAAPGRCAHCGARLQPADQWCGLCHTPVPAQRSQPPAEAVAGEPGAGSSARLARRVAAELPALDGPRPPIDHPGLLDGRRLAGGEVPPEQLDELLNRLARSETASDPRIQLGMLAGLHGRAGGLLLAGVMGLVLLAGVMLALFVLGTLI